MNAEQTNRVLPPTYEEDCWFEEIAERITDYGFEAIKLAGRTVITTAETMLYLFERNNVAGAAQGEVEEWL